MIPKGLIPQLLQVDLGLIRECRDLSELEERQCM